MTKRAGLQRGAGVALWRQIADEIRQGIATTLADADGRLPPESQLAQRFGVNRHTVRAAIATLASEGVVQAVQGRGTYVRRRKRLTYPIGMRTRFSAALEGQSQTARSELLDHSIEPATSEIAQALALPERSPVIRLETLGKADGIPVSRATSWFCATRFSGLDSVFADTNSVTAALRAFGVTDYVRVSTHVEARHADEFDSMTLNLSPGAIVLVAAGINADTKGTPIQYSRTRFPADRVELVIGKK